jgi:hypothetical protein
VILRDVAVHAVPSVPRRARRQIVQRPLRNSFSSTAPDLVVFHIPRIKGFHCAAGGMYPRLLLTEVFDERLSRMDNVGIGEVYFVVHHLFASGQRFSGPIRVAQGPSLRQALTGA